MSKIAALPLVNHGARWNCWNSLALLSEGLRPDRVPYFAPLKICIHLDNQTCRLCAILPLIGIRILWSTAMRFLSIGAVAVVSWVSTLGSEALAQRPIKLGPHETALMSKLNEGTIA